MLAPATDTAPVLRCNATHATCIDDVGVLRPWPGGGVLCTWLQCAMFNLLAHGHDGTGDDTPPPRSTPPPLLLRWPRPACGAVLLGVQEYLFCSKDAIFQPPKAIR